MLLSQLSKISTYKHLNQKASKTPCIVEFPKIIVIIFLHLKKDAKSWFAIFFYQSDTSEKIHKLTFSVTILL